MAEDYFLLQKISFLNTSIKFCLIFWEAEEVKKILTYVWGLISKAFVLYFPMSVLRSLE